jgi:transmembrane sensor
MSDVLSDEIELLVDYVSDALAPEARMAVEARLEHDAAFQATAAPLLAAWRVTPRAADHQESADAVAALQRAIDADDVRRRRRPVRVAAITLAASLVIAVVGVYGPGLYRIVAPVVRAHHVADYVTTVGERRTVRLPDGSRATLGPESGLTYRSTFFEAVPVMRMHGDVNFDVVSRVTVLADFARIDGATGRFEIAAYPEDADVRVTVVDGGVRVSVGGSVTGTIPAGSTAHVLDTAIVIGPTRDDGVVRWDGDRLTFERVPLAEAVRAMRHWYGVDVRLGDGRLGARPITATLPADAHAAVAALGARVVWTGNTATLY